MEDPFCGIAPARPHSTATASPLKSMPEQLLAPSRALGFVPDAREINDLAKSIAAVDCLDLRAFPQIQASATERDRMLLYDQLIAVTRAPLIDKIVECQKQDRKDEPTHYTAIALDRSVVTIVVRLSQPDEELTLRSLLNSHLGAANLYVGLNPVAHSLGHRRPAAKDILASSRCALDIDRAQGESEDDFARRLAPALALGKRLEAKSILMTGGGVQMQFLLERITDATAMAARAAAFNATFGEWGSDPVNDAPRILRLENSINIPTATKREKKGRWLALARSVWTSGAPRVWCDHALQREWSTSVPAVKQAASSRKSSTEGANKAPTAIKNRCLPERAPSVAMACEALRIIPNIGHYDLRENWVAICSEVKGASGGHPDARQAFLEWCARWHLGGDPVADAALWDSMEPRRGWRELLVSAAVHDPQAAARLAFAAVKEQGGSDAEATDAATRARAGLAGSGGSGGAGAGGGRDEAHAFLVAAGLKVFRSDQGGRFCELRDSIHDLDAGDLGPVMGLLIQQGFRLSKQAKSDLQEMLRDEASISQDIRTVHVRFAFAGGKIYVDNVGNNSDVAVITPGKYSIEPRGVDGVCFYRPTTQKTIGEPQDDATGRTFIERLRAHVNLPPVQGWHALDDGVKAEANCLMLFCGILYHQGTRPLGSFTGHQGTGKSVALQRVKAVVDPTDPDRTTMPADVRGLFVTAAHAGVPAYDNSSEISGPISDACCCITSGTAYQDRQLFTNGGQFTMKVHRPILVTSVLANVTTRPDFLDRTISVPLVAPTVRRSERDLNEKFEHERAGLQHALFDLASRALALLPKVEAQFANAKLPRLADVALFAEAAAQAEGWPAGLLLDAARATREHAAADLLESNPIVIALHKVMERSGGRWEGSADGLREAMTTSGGLPRTGPGSCRSPESLVNRLDRVKGPLVEQGWKFENKRTASARLIRITAPAPAATENSDHPF